MDLDAIAGGLHDDSVDISRSRARMLQHESGHHQRQHAGHCYRCPGAGKQRVAQRFVLGAHAFTRSQPQPDIGFHLGGQALPRDFRRLVKVRENFPQAEERGHLFATLLASTQMAIGAPPGHEPQVAARVQRQGRLSWMFHRFLLSMYPRNFVRALAMWDRTVALEQFRRRATSSAGKPSTSRSINAARSRGLSRRRPSSR